MEVLGVRRRETDTLQVQKQGGGKPTTRPDLHRVVTQPEGISLTDGNCQSRHRGGQKKPGMPENLLLLLVVLYSLNVL